VKVFNATNGPGFAGGELKVPSARNGCRM